MSTESVIGSNIKLVPSVRPYLAILLLLVLSLQQAFNIISSIQLRQHQQQMLHLAKAIKSTHSFNFSSDEWQSIQKVNDHEILIGHRLFDISSMIKTNTGVFIEGHYDTKEDHLTALSKHLNAQKQKVLLEKQFSFLYTILIVQTTDQRLVGYDLPCAQIAPRNPVLFAANLQNDTPPPRFI